MGDRLIDGKEGPEAITDRRNVGLLIRDCLETLPEREQLIAEMYYFNDRTFKEIASALGVTESRVSQLHTRMKKRIKETMAEELEPLTT